MTFIEPAILLAAAGAAGTAVSAAGTIQQGRAAAAASRRNAAVAEAEGARAKQVAAFEANRVRERVRRLLSTQRAAAGASSGSLGGSPLQVMAESAAQGEIDARLVLQSGSIAAARAQSQAGIDRANAKASLFGGFVGGGATLLGGGVRAGQLALEAKALEVKEP